MKWIWQQLCLLPQNTNAQKVDVNVRGGENGYGDIRRNESKNVHHFMMTTSCWAYGSHPASLNLLPKPAFCACNAAFAAEAGINGGPISLFFPITLPFGLTATPLAFSFSTTATRDSPPQLLNRPTTTSSTPRLTANRLLTACPPQTIRVSGKEPAHTACLPRW
jgi:hypothetical protein